MIGKVCLVENAITFSTLRKASKVTVNWKENINVVIVRSSY